MTTFEVTPADLQSLAGQLSGLLGELASAGSTINSGAAGAAQNGDLEGAIGTFLGDWKSGLDNLQHELSAVSDRLDAAGVAYQATDGSIGSSFGP